MTEDYKYALSFFNDFTFEQISLPLDRLFTTLRSAVKAAHCNTHYGVDKRAYVKYGMSLYAVVRTVDGGIPEHRTVYLGKLLKEITCSPSARMEYVLANSDG